MFTTDRPKEPTVMILSDSTLAEMSVEERNDYLEELELCFDDDERAAMDREEEDGEEW